MEDRDILSQFVDKKAPPRYGRFVAVWNNGTPENPELWSRLCRRPAGGLDNEILKAYDHFNATWTTLSRTSTTYEVIVNGLKDCVYITIDPREE